MNPDDATLLLYQQLVEVLAAHIADVQQDGSIAQSIINPLVELSFDKTLVRQSSNEFGFALS